MAPAVIESSHAISQLCESHYRELSAGSGLSDETIEAAGFRSVTDPLEVAQRLNQRSPDAFADYLPALFIPFFDAEGDRTGYGRFKLRQPRPGRGKYESPVGGGNQIYFPPLSVLHEAMKDSLPIFITEGEKKALRACQAGVPCLGITGNWNWTYKQPDTKARSPIRPVLDALREACRDRLVFIVPDSDPLAIANNEHAFSELGQSLTHICNSRVRLLKIPFVSYDLVAGLPHKMGLDDYALATSDEAVQKLYHDAIADVNRAEVSVEEYRDEMVRNRRGLQPGKIYLDRSPTGSGKTEQDIIQALQFNASLMLTDSHAQGSEIEARMKRHAANPHGVAKYPSLSGKTENETEDEEGKLTAELNCLNFDEATRALGFGLPPSRAVCPKCEFRTDCEYREKLQLATNAPHAIATKSRAEFTLASMAENKEVVSIQEASLGSFAVLNKVSSAEAFQQVAELAESLEAEYWDRMKIEGGRWFMKRLEDNARVFVKAIQNERPIELSGRVQGSIPSNYRTFPSLYRRCVEKWSRPSSQFDNAMRLCLDSVEGTLHTICGVRYTGRFYVVGVKRPKLPDDVIITINDGTDAGLLQRVTDRPVADVTPDLKQEQVHLIRQYPEDVTRNSSPKTLLGYARTIMELHPDAERVGIITHNDTADRAFKSLFEGKAVEHGGRLFQLEDRYLNRIAKVAHFGGDDARGSNGFAEDCDMLIVLGSPRPGPTAVTDLLVQLGDVKAAMRDGIWMRKDDTRPYGGKYSRHTWLAQTESGKARAIRGKEYADYEWRAAHQALANAELRQCVGRARANLQDGIPCIVVSTMDIGLPVVDLGEDLWQLNTTHVQIIESVEEGLQTAAQISDSTGLKTHVVEKARTELAKNGILVNRGSRTRPDWYLACVF